MQGVESYSRAATERAMKVQVVILRAVAKKIKWWQTAEIVGITAPARRLGLEGCGVKIGAEGSKTRMRDHNCCVHYCKFL